MVFEKLDIQEGIFRNFFRDLSTGVSFGSFEGRLLMVNPAFCEMLGYTENEITNFEYRDVVHPEDIDEYFRRTDILIRGLSDSTSFEIRFRKISGETVWALVSSFLLTDEDQGDQYVVTNIQDTTRTRHLEIQLRQAQKLEAIGTLAGGIAHDFNNILAAILGYTSMARDDIPESNPARYQLDEVITAANRAKDLVKHILTFSRTSDLKRNPVSPDNLVNETLDLIRASLPSTIEVKRDVSSECGMIMAVSTQIHQVVMNLCTNAAHAMEENGGVLEVSLDKTELTCADLADEPELQPGQYVRITIKDTGIGMDRHIVDRIFDPYFTTKETDKGSGLGLTVVQGIMKKHHGSIRVESEPGKGTIFTVCFPALAEEYRGNFLDVGPMATGNEKILVVDDESAMVDMTSKVLSRLGYHVTGSTGGEEALTLFTGSPASFDLVITDQTMPGMTGIQMSEKMLGLRPDIPILLRTSSCSKLDEEKAQSIGIRKYAMKTIDLRDLSGMIRSLLDQNEAENNHAVV